LGWLQLNERADHWQRWFI